MVDIFSFIVAFWRSLLGKLSECKFSMLGYNVDLLSVLVVLGIIAFVITIFWKGARK